MNAATIIVGAVVAQNVFFYIIAAVMVIAALRVVTTDNIVHAALYLVVVLAGVAAQFLLLGAEFVGMTQVLVYIGAVVVLFLFGIMLTRAKVGSEDRLNHDNIWPALLTGILLFCVMAFSVIDFAFADSADALGRYVDLDTGQVFDSQAAADAALEANADARIVQQVDALFAADPAKAASASGGAAEIAVLDVDENKVADVSDSIFSTYIVAFEAISVLLLAALIGAIVVARKE